MRISRSPPCSSTTNHLPIASLVKYCRLCVSGHLHWCECKDVHSKNSFDTRDILLQLLFSPLPFTEATFATLSLVRGPERIRMMEIDVLQAWAIITVIVDIAITASMLAMVCVSHSLISKLYLMHPFAQLSHAKSSSYFRETRDRISHLLRLTIQTGFITCVFTIPIPILFYKNQASLYLLPFVTIALIQ